MIRRVRTSRRTGATFALANLLALAPMAVATVATPAPSWACQIGQVAEEGGCAPYCGEDTLLDTRSGECRDPLSALVSDFSGVDDLPASPQLPEISSPSIDIGLPGIGLPSIGVDAALPSLPAREPICGPGVQTPIPMVGFTPCV